MHVWDSRRKRMEEEGESILCQSWSSSAGGLGHGQSHHIWQLIVSQELPERHCHSEGTQPYYYQNTKWHSERSTESLCVIPVCVCQRHRKKKRCGEACGEALVITPRPDVTSSLKKTYPQQTEEFYKSIKTSFGGQSLCQDSQRRPADFLSEARSHDLWPQCSHLSTQL